MDSKQEVLAAFPPFALPTLARLLGTCVHLVPASSMAEARNQLAQRPGIALVTCGVHFDESRMFDLLRYARRAFPRLPFVCCRVLSSEVSRISRASIEIAAASLGAAAFVDLPALAEELGDEEAGQRFRAVVLVQLALRRMASGA
jgi:hypothetical protein